MYLIVRELEPSHPSVHHQLARIAFLRGDFFTALSLIHHQIALHGDNLPNSYYIRGLIEGYAGLYEKAVLDYEHYLTYDPDNWAAINDYAWVLLKDGKAETALTALEHGLEYHPDNAWLLNSKATALFELGRYAEALQAAEAAVRSAQDLGKEEWLVAYPGNDPAIAGEGLASLRNAIRENMHTIESAIATSTVQ